MTKNSLRCTDKLDRHILLTLNIRMNMYRIPQMVLQIIRMVLLNSWWHCLAVLEVCRMSLINMTLDNLIIVDLFYLMIFKMDASSMILSNPYCMRCFHLVHICVLFSRLGGG